MPLSKLFLCFQIQISEQIEIENTFWCVCVYLMDGFEERPVQVCESSRHVPGVNA